MLVHLVMQLLETFSLWVVYEVSDDSHLIGKTLDGLTPKLVTYSLPEEHEVTSDS